MLQTLKHESIIAYKDSFVEADNLCILMEWASGGDLASEISRRKASGRRFSDKEIVSLMHQLVKGARSPARP